MGITLDQILMLAGRLDDAQGFDSPRERFRRFLIDHVRDIQTGRALIEQCQHAPGNQHRRALEDLVVLLGRFIGFDTTFAAHSTTSTGPEHHGVWQSRAHFQILVDVRSDQTAVPDFEGLLRSAPALKQISRPTGIRLAALCVLTPLCMNRGKIEEAIKAVKPAFLVGVVPLAAIVSLAETVASGRMTHADAVRLFESNIPIDFIVNLLETFAARPSVESPEPAVPRAPSNLDRPSFWIASVVPDHATAPEEFLELVVAKRHIFGVAENGHAGSAARDGDWICFYIPGKGVVGHARVASLAKSGSGLRDAHRFRQLLQLEDLDLYLGAPVAPDSETQLRLRTAPSPSRRNVQTLVGISRDSFQTITSPRKVPLEATEQS